MNTNLRRASTQTSATSTSSRITPSIHNRRSTDSRVLDEVLHDGDEIGPGFSILGQPIHIVHARTSQVTPMKIIRKLGTGSYAVVYLAQEILPYSGGSSFLDIHEHSPPATPAPIGRFFAVKCLAKNTQDQDAQLLEATIHQSLPVHDNVVTLWHTLETASYLLLVLDYVPGEDLFYFLEQARDHDPSDGSPTTPPTPSMLASLHPEQLLSTQRLHLIASMFSQMCGAVAHCHRNGVFHRDIKPENFMVTDSRSFNPDTGKYERKVSVKLTDFGLATRDTESGDMDCGSAPYMSFECHNNITPTYATAPADVWSLGIVLINMLYHANPWLTTAAGQCDSFDYFLREPIPFFMNRFPGMTPAVAEFFARSVFCLLGDDANPISPSNYVTNTGRRITAERFGQWARDMPHHLGPSARRTPALAFQQSPNPTSASRPRSPGEVSNRLMAPSMSQPGTRTPSLTYRTRPPVPVHANAANYDVVDLESDSDSDPGEQMRTSSSKRRKRALRGKAAPVQSDAALYAASVLAAKSQAVAREASLIKSTKTPPSTFAALAPTPIVVDLTTTPPASSRINTLTAKRSVPELKRKKSNKWTEIFKRDSGSDLEVTSSVDWAALDREDARTSLSSPADVSSGPSATAKNVTSLLNALNSASTSTVPDEGESWTNGRSSSLSSRGRRNDKRNVGRDNQRAASPGSLISVSTTNTAASNANNTGRGRSAPSADRRARSKSPTQAALEKFNTLAPSPASNSLPPVPAVPESYRGSVPVPSQLPTHAYVPPQSSRRSYAPSIASVSTTTTSSSALTAFSGKNKWRSSNSSASVRSVSTAATSVSSGSWRTTASGNRKPVPPLPLNIKPMDGIPMILDELPRHDRHRGPNADYKKRQRAPSAPNSPTPGASFGLDTINEKPKKSSMKQPRTGGASNQSRFFAGAISGKSMGVEYSVYQPILPSNTVDSFDPSGTSFAVPRGGLPMGLKINTDVSNENSLGYVSGMQGQIHMQVVENVGSADIGGAPGKPPKTPTKSRWWRK